METMQLFYDNLAGAKAKGTEPGRTALPSPQQNEGNPAADSLYFQSLAQLAQSSLDQLTALKTLLGWRPWM